MHYFLIKNIKNPLGQIDYKGFDISKFVPGSQVYPVDCSECVIATTESTVPNHSDITPLSEAEYLAEGERLKATYPPEPESELEIVKRQLAEAEQAILELSMIMGGV